MMSMRELMECENHENKFEYVEHSHCNSCIKVNRCVMQLVSSESCEIVTCELNCGNRFHGCKLSEHKLLCPNEKVACINAGNGCPIIMLRHQRASHLETCPASVVICTMEWNRLPVSSEVRRVPISNAKQGQLDIALTMRDQRMLNKLMKVPNKTKFILQNDLTKCFPAVPFQSWPSSEVENHVISSADTDILKECSNASPGLESTVCGELYKITKDNYSDTLADNQFVQEPSQESLRFSPTYYNSSNNCTSDSELLENDGNELSQIHFKTESNFQESEEVDSIEKLYNNLDNMNTNYKEDQSNLFKGSSVNNTHSEIFSASVTDHATSITSPPSSIPTTIMPLGLDLTLEYITRYQTKPKNMYTFFCAQEFRRDEYSWHYKNVHCDIHSGLNGWLEYRCPLAHYGCMYSLRRLYPTVKGSTVIHNDALESFGVKPPINYDILVVKHPASCHSKMEFNKKNLANIQDWPITSQPVILSQLPFEVLRHVCRFLDSFSLCNLSLTCRHLREVCCSLLEERGLVAQRWKKSICGSKVSWTEACKHWFFSTAFTPVLQWGFQGEDNMSNHMRICTNFERNIKSKPYFHLFGCEPDPQLYAKLVSNGEKASDII